MTTKRTICGVELRYVLTFYLSQHGRTTIPDLIDALDYYNFDIPGQPSKSVSDALRWEIAHNRVRRLRRGLYGPGKYPVLPRTGSASGCSHYGPKPTCWPGATGTHGGMRCQVECMGGRTCRCPVGIGLVLAPIRPTEDAGLRHEGAS